MCTGMGQVDGGLQSMALPVLSENALRDLRRRLGPAPMRALFEVVAEPLAQPAPPGCASRWYAATSPCAALASSASVQVSTTVCLQRVAHFINVPHPPEPARGATPATPPAGSPPTGPTDHLVQDKPRSLLTKGIGSSSRVAHAHSVINTPTFSGRSSWLLGAVRYAVAGVRCCAHVPRSPLNAKWIRRETVGSSGTATAEIRAVQESVLAQTPVDETAPQF